LVSTDFFLLSLKSRILSFTEEAEADSSPYAF
jgi:hypothetical protein